jgi:hypothetical protein
MLGFDHPDLASFEDKFVAGVPKHFAAIVRVLREDKVPEKRAAAAFLVAYGKSRADVIAALVPSIPDPASLVRNNVVRVLVMVQKGADTAILPLDPLLRALTFPETTDRNKALYALAELLQKSPKPHPQAKVILARAGDMLRAAAALQQPNNRDPAAAILRLLSGE